MSTVAGQADASNRFVRNSSGSSMPRVSFSPSSGGFLSLRGWNSILESLWYGVLIVTWPRYAEQQLNAFRMVKELGLAVELRLDSTEDNELELVPAEEIARAVRYVMERVIPA